MPLSRINTNSIANNTIQGADVLDASITAAKIISVANTQITGNIVSSQITSVANTQITGTITGSQISSNTLSNTVFQTGAVENYLRGTNLDFGMRNRIINGAMVIDQRNAGASSSSASNSIYFLDRWLQNNNNGSSRFTVQQNAGSVTPPTGFANYLGITSSGAYSITGNDILSIYQKIEGYNIADLGWGTASAKTVTLSFWVRSSLTGTFGGSLLNSATDRSYPFTYTISSANTWEQKSVTITGDTSGTWLTTNGVGVNIYFSLGTVSTYNGTAGSWSGNAYFSATGATSVVGTNGATFYITGVQLEKGSTATSFDYRPYGTELVLCQRYYEKSYDIGTVPGTATSAGQSVTNGLFNITTTSYILINPQFRVTKRGSVTTNVWDYSGNSGKCVRANLGVSDTANSIFAVTAADQTCFSGYSSGGVTATNINLQWVASSEL